MCNFSLCPKGFFHTPIVLALHYYPPSADLSIIAFKENFQNAGNGCRKSHVILSYFMQPGPESYDSTYHSDSIVKCLFHTCTDYFIVLRPVYKEHIKSTINHEHKRDHERKRGVCIGLRISNLYESVYTKGYYERGWKLARAKSRRENL